MNIYIDTNILCRLKTDAEYSKINDFLAENDKVLNVFYSNAHLLDLKKDTTNIKYIDLQTIKEIVGNRYLCKYFKKPVMIYDISPKDAFDSLIDDKYEIANITEDLVKNNPQIQESVFHLKKALADMEVDTVDISALPTALQNYLGTILKQKESFSFSELIKAGMKFYTELNENDEEYKNLRGLILKNKANIFFDSQANALDTSINDLFSNSLFKAKFLEYIDDKNSRLNSDPNEMQYNRFVIAYNILNSFGLDKEKNKKARFSNTFIDSLHAYYASFCDLFITDDNGIKNKCSVIYKLFDIKTFVINSQELSEVKI